MCVLCTHVQFAHNGKLIQEWHKLNNMLHGVELYLSKCQDGAFNGEIHKCQARRLSS